jgi:tubulin polyglutamylase TTLL9
MWILKSRTGYGSHGNVIVTTAQDITSATSSLSQDQQQRCNVNPTMLLQKVIDPPLLIDGRVFSLRIYVHYFIVDDGTTSSCIISNHGLVKLASLPYQDGSDEVSRRMTNSGRRMDAVQMNLTVLRTKLGSSIADEVMKQVHQAVYVVMDIYGSEIVTKSINNTLSISSSSHGKIQEYRKQVARACFPKILGFDFLVDNDLQPWLLEVNRFPGLEARDEQDAQIKEAVLLEAWELATKRHAKR